MEVLLWSLLIAGLLGAVLPVLPGPILSASAVLVYMSMQQMWNSPLLWLLVLLGVALFLADFLLPGWLARRGGGSKYASRGANIGLFLGLILGPGLLLGVVLGAFVGEYFFNKASAQESVKSSIYATLGVLTGIIVKLIYGLFLIGLYLMSIY